MSGITNMERKQKIFTTAHREYGYSKLGAQHYAFEVGAEWADNNPAWELCTDSNYWNNTDANVVTVVKYNDIDGKSHIYTEETSPFGWNVFVKNHSYKLDLKLTCDGSEGNDED